MGIYLFETSEKLVVHCHFRSRFVGMRNLTPQIQEKARFSQRDSFGTLRFAHRNDIDVRFLRCLLIMKNCLIRSLVLIFFCLPVLHAQENSATNFSAETMNGEIVSLSDYLKNGPVYVSFWTTWCEPCKAELKMLKALADTYRPRGLTVLAINKDDPKTAAKVKAYVRSQKFTFPVLVDPDERIFKQLNGSQVPYSLLIDKNGMIVRRRTGYLAGDEKTIAKDFEEILSGKNQ